MMSVQSDLSGVIFTLNCAVICFRSAYRKWCASQKVNYHEMLIFYSLSETPDCTQTDICNSYMLPKQTIHNTVMRLKKQGYLTLEQAGGNQKEKYLRLTPEGQVYADRIVRPLREAEIRAVKQTGMDKVRLFADSFIDYSKILNRVMNPEDEEV